MNRKEQLLYSLLMDFGPKCLNPEEMKRFIDCFLNILKERTETGHNSLLRDEIGKPHYDGK